LGISIREFGLRVVSKSTPAPPPPDVDARVEALTAVVFATLDRLARLEAIIARLASAAGIDAPPVIASEWRTIKTVSHDMECSPSNVHKLIRLGRLIAEKRGGRVLVRADSIPTGANK
jgi:hypothetical protein